LKQKFLDDFAGASTQTKALLNQNPNLIDAWEIVSHRSTVLRRNTNVLDDLSTAIQRGSKEVSDILAHANHSDITTYTIEHIFRGHGNNGGRHHISSLLSDNTRSLVDRIQETADGFYVAMIKRADGTVKPKSFWPDAWDEYKIMDELKYVMANNPINITGNTWEGLTSTGQKIHYYVKTSDNSIISAFPILE